MLNIPHEPWSQTGQAVLSALAVNPETGLAKDAVAERQAQAGHNRLRQIERRSAGQILLDQFKSLVVLLLVVAAVVSITFGELVDGLAILAVVFINALLGFGTELKAVRSMEALQEMGDVQSRVRRDGKVQELNAEELVPGDLLILESGDVVTADVRLLEAAKLQADEAAFTGESVPVDKQTTPVVEETSLAERSNMAYKGTAITRGSGSGVVINIGMETELGQISALVEDADAEQTPLEVRLDKLGQRLIVVTLVVAALVAVVGLLQGRGVLQMIETAIALAVAAIPEGLPIVATIALARGMQRMARRNVLVNRLAAVETLGGTKVICADKTGTLTENQMTLVTLALPSGVVEVSGEGLQRDGTFSQGGLVIKPAEHKNLLRALEVGALCTNATLPATDAAEAAIGDPVEVALLVAAAKGGLLREELVTRMPEEREVAFDPDVKMMATIHQKEGSYRVAVKGSPEAVLESCTNYWGENGPESWDQDQRQEWLVQNVAMAADGLRVLAVAEKEVSDPTATPYQRLTFLGLVGLLDPPRVEVQEAIHDCRAAGMRVVMVTGDQAATARKVALAVGLVDDAETNVLDGQELQTLIGDDDDQALDRLREATILARVTPRQKLDLIDFYQQAGQIVAMTGDGVNDAPALKKADIGVAMGQRGTQVAKEAADMVLQDDTFGSIVTAVREGRAIFNNIRKFVLYLLSCNLGEIITVGLASILVLPLPVLPLQILFLNLVTDVFPALALGVGEVEAGVMARPPRDPDEPILLRRHWWAIGGYACLLAFSVLGALALAQSWLHMSRQQAVTISFLTLAATQLWHIFSMRDTGTNLIRNEISSNPWVWAALALCAVLLLLAVYLPPLSAVLQTSDPGLSGWLVVLGMSLLPTIVSQFLKEKGIGRI
ncbi:MAG: cation-transporting P-type ATPase [Anaerolineales bacterium]|nr:cation-transporting P-type ATPase [Anaerolineales bacterium]MCB0031930.1 cation-transporting P-type ATPase [Anaerolineales bacterium]